MGILLFLICNGNCLVSLNANRGYNIYGLSFELFLLRSQLIAGQNRLISQPKIHIQLPSHNHSRFESYQHLCLGPPANKEKGNRK